MRSLTLWVCALTLVACGTPVEDRDHPVAKIDGSTLTRGELEHYLAINLAKAESAEPETDGDLIRSLLLQSWIDEHLILDQAARHGLAIEDDQLDEMLDDPSYERGEGDRESQRGYLRERLLIELVQGEVLQTIVPPPLEQLGPLLPELSEQRRSAELRSLRFDSLADAQQVHENLRRDRLTFNEAVVQNSDGESQGVATLVEPETLPPGVRKVVEELRPGWSSAPVELGGSVYLFQVVAWHASSRAERLAAMQRESYAGLRREAWEVYLGSLRAGAEIRIIEKNLPFRYVAGSAEAD